MDGSLTGLLRELGIDGAATRCAIVAAHPDDEVIGATFLLRSGEDVHVIHATDGAPRDRVLWSPIAPARREDYAALRAKEALDALRLAGVRRQNIHALGFCDQEAAHDLAGLTRALRAVLGEFAPDVVVVHPYEGGHPDHDATAFAAHVAARALGAAVIEMTSYHRSDGALRTGGFLRAVSPVAERRVEGKRALLDCFASQAQVLSAFTDEVERFRRAPPYDFTRPPHPGTLHYETLGWPMTGARFCVSAAEALRRMEERPLC